LRFHILFLTQASLANLQGFKDYVEHFLKGHEDETGNQIKPIHELCSDRWEVAVAVSDNGFQQVGGHSFLCVANLFQIN
jgi:hypothetical protein